MPRDLVTGGWRGYAKALIEPEECLSRLLLTATHVFNGHAIGIKKWIEKREYLTYKDQASKRKIFVKFQPCLTVPELYAHFSEFGRIESIECKCNPNTNMPRQFGYIVFEDEDCARDAASFGNVNSDSQKISCEMTKPKHIMDKMNYSRFDIQCHQDGTRLQQDPGYSSGNRGGLALRSNLGIDRFNVKQTSWDHRYQYGYQKTSNNRSKVSKVFRKEKSNRMCEANIMYHKINELKRKTPQIDAVNNKEMRMRVVLKNTELNLVGRENQNEAKYSLKPTSNQYPAHTRETVSMNHYSTENICFNLLTSTSVRPPERPER